MIKRNCGGVYYAKKDKSGIPCLDGFGVQGGAIHSRDEWAYLGLFSVTHASMPEVSKMVIAASLESIF